ncbi:MAG: bifunctional DNA-formamidopyrimidine glycosylase/DNA-(apurinic or apyrimidinic site) lyase [Alphaproteobacteria bacterium]
MPELPEVETVKRGLNKNIIGKEITSIIWSGKKLRRGLLADVDYHYRQKNNEMTFRHYWHGKKIIKIIRRGKYIILVGDGERVLLCHLGMSGFFRFLRHHDKQYGFLRQQLDDEKKCKKYMRTQHLHLLFFFHDSVLAFYDTRRFGFISDIATKDLYQHKALAILGIEPLTMDIDDLLKNLQKYNLSLKTFLLNQKIIVGIGNIYAAEILWYAGLSPKKKCWQVKSSDGKKLLKAIKKVLLMAIKKGGSSFSDFQNIDGELGYFAYGWRVYGKHGEKCQYCGGVIKKFLQNGRTTYYCSRHQK